MRTLLKLTAAVVFVTVGVTVNTAAMRTSNASDATATPPLSSSACEICRQYCSGRAVAAAGPGRADHEENTDMSTGRAPCACDSDVVCGDDDDDDDGRSSDRWTESEEYYLLVINLENLSIAFVLITFNVYAWMLTQRGTSNYVKHYLAFFTLLLSLRRLKKDFCPKRDPCDERSIKRYGCYELFALACTNYWQIVMCIEYLYFLRYIDKLNSFTTNISSRNKIYHVCCWLFSTLWTYLAFTLEIHQFIIPETNSSDIMKENDWFSTLRYNYKYMFFFYVPGLTNILINVIILLLSFFIFKSKTIKDHGKTKGFEKLLIRKQLFVVLTFIWMMDVLAFIDQNNDQRQWLQAMNDIVKALNGTITCFILMFKHHILMELKNKVHVFWQNVPYPSRRRISNAVCVKPVVDTDSNEDKCIL